MYQKGHEMYQKGLDMDLTIPTLYRRIHEAVFGPINIFPINKKLKHYTRYFFKNDYYFVKYLERYLTRCWRSVWPLIFKLGHSFAVLRPTIPIVRPSRQPCRA